MPQTDEWYLICRVAGRLIGLPLTHVAEIMRPPALEQPEPGTAHNDVAAVASNSANLQASSLRGLALLRGELTPVVDLAAWLGLDHPDAAAGATPPASRRLVSTRLPATGSPTGHQPAGLLVDEVLGTECLAASALSRIDLPGGAERHIARFDAGLAECLHLAGLLHPDATPNVPVEATP